MYNTDFSRQMRNFERDLWGAGCVDTRLAAREASIRGYVPPLDMKMTPCYEDWKTGEFIPVSQKLVPYEENMGKVRTFRDSNTGERLAIAA